MAYFAAVAARAETAIQRDNIHLLDDYTTLLERQERSGLVPRNDVLRAHLAAATARAARRGAAAQLKALRSELAILTSIEVPAVSLTEPETTPFAEPTDEMLDASPVMVDARSAVEAARRDADAAHSEWRGRVTLTASGGALGVQPGPTFRDNAGGQFLFGFSLPLFDGGVTAARIAAAVASVNSAEAMLRQTRQTVSIALSRVRVEARRAQADVATWRRVVPQAVENFQLMRARHFGGGNVRLLEVLDALSQYVDARLNVPRAELSLRMADATQRQILGETLP
jgi:outer membrane protein TolC